MINSLVTGAAGFLKQHLLRRLDPARRKDKQNQQAFFDKKVLITGGSSGIGLACAKEAVRYGAHVAIAGRDREKLIAATEEISSNIKNQGSICWQQCDLADLEDCERLVKAVLDQQGVPDILFNNAGHSIRRSISRSYDRFHDIERTMQLNYFGGAKLILGFLPAMVSQGGGQIIHSSTMGTMAPTPRFGAYLASKAAMDAFLDALVAEYADRNIITTAIKFPLVKTPMIAPTKAYADAPAASPESAARMFVKAVVQKPRRVVTGTGKTMGFLTLFAPEVMTHLYNYGYRIWPDSDKDYPEMGRDRRLVSKVIKQSPL